MYESNINWMLAVASLLAGIGIGALGYHLLNSNMARNQQMRQRLAETELELNQVKGALNEHFIKAADLVSGIQRQSRELEAHLAQSAEHLCDDPQLKHRLSGAQQADDTPPEEALEMPRDYADGGRGTLAEDFGLRQADEDEEKAPAQPPRH